MRIQNLFYYEMGMLSMDYEVFMARNDTEAIIIEHERECQHLKSFKFLSRKNLSWIEDASWIKDLFDTCHGTNCCLALDLIQVLVFTLAQTVLRGY